MSLWGDAHRRGDNQPPEWLAVIVLVLLTLAAVGLVGFAAAIIAPHGPSGSPVPTQTLHQRMSTMEGEQ